MGCLTTGTNASIVADSALFTDLENSHVGVSAWIDVDGTKMDGIAAQANVSSTWIILVNAPGVFFYGGGIPGTQLSGGTPSGQIRTE